MTRSADTHKACKKCGGKFTWARAKFYCSPRCRFLSIADPFFGKDDCWTWPKSFMQANGYGQFGIWDSRSCKRKIVSAHKYSYMVFRGPVPDGMLVCHHCDNPKCFNPSHLFLGSTKDNHNDMVSKGRAAWQRKCMPTYTPPVSPREESK